MSLFQFFAAAFGVFVAFCLGVIYIPKPVPYRWEIKLFLLMGMPISQFLSFCIKNGIDPVFWHRFLYASYMSLLNSLFWIPKEQQNFPDEKVQATEIKQPPIFVLGHFRSGTSLLQELMNKDENMVAPSVFQCYTPTYFLYREDYMYSKFNYIKVRRPMDRMRVTLSSAFEDEFALANISGISPYMGAIFPRQFKEYERYLTFKNATDEEIDLWKKGAMWFYKKVMFRHQEKRLLLKSPAHTARIKLLLEMFPDAKFVHISRNPYDIYKSTFQLHHKLLVQWCLQRPNLEKEHVAGIILNHFKEMYDAYFEQVSMIPPENFTTCTFKDLITSPSKTLDKIYTELDLPGYDKLKPIIEEYENGAQKTFKMNQHTDIPDEEKKLIQTSWGPYFREFDYEM